MDGIKDEILNFGEHRCGSKFLFIVKESHYWKFISFKLR